MPQPTTLAGSNKCVVSYAVWSGRRQGPLQGRGHHRQPGHQGRQGLEPLVPHAGRPGGLRQRQARLDQQTRAGHGQLQDHAEPAAVPDDAVHRPLQGQQRGPDGVQARRADLRDVRVAEARRAVPAGRAPDRRRGPGSARCRPRTRRSRASRSTRAGSRSRSRCRRPRRRWSAGPTDTAHGPQVIARPEPGGRAPRNRSVNPSPPTVPSSAPSSPMTDGTDAGAELDPADDAGRRSDGPRGRRTGGDDAGGGTFG